MSSERPPASGLVESRQAVQVRRAPRYYRFIILGLLLGAVVTIGVTWMFPEQPDFTRWQVAGLLALFVVPSGAALGAVVALVIDAVSRRRARLVEVDHIEGHDEPEPLAPQDVATPQPTAADAGPVAAHAHAAHPAAARDVVEATDAPAEPSDAVADPAPDEAEATDVPSSPTAPERDPKAPGTSAP